MGGGGAGRGFSVVRQTIGASSTGWARPQPTCYCAAMHPVCLSLSVSCGGYFIVQSICKAPAARTKCSSYPHGMSLEALAHFATRVDVALLLLLLFFLQIIGVDSSLFVVDIAVLVAFYFAACLFVIGVLSWRHRVRK